ncbi:hypothetical protein AWL63_04145 [Sphingomonas panacis]|uniref:CHK kinase-like domain-containing protein n=1 Tax=Sphingomonas panacis TaxID=1560345 RepID=A0A1B3Z769_9SPHN|nr:phosphotransferase [Sphingomonas panacis]AOH83282.1 hypothetical protein AWL63_04145 [Sphingomonas panacis]
MRTPRELIELYWDRVWNQGEADMVRELCHDPIVRHDPGCVTRLSHDEQIARIKHRFELQAPFFTHEVLIADDDCAVSVWNAHTRKGPRIERCGIEVFRIVDGRFMDCWNSSYMDGFWGVEGDPGVPDDLPPPEMLETLEHITPGWVQRVFAHACVQVPLVTLARLEPVSTGNVSATARVHINYNIPSQTAPTSLIAKFHPKTPRPGGMAEKLGYYPREAAVYGLFGMDPPVQTPRLYYAETGGAGTKVNLVLEDLGKDFVPGDQVKGCNAAEAEAVIDQLARLHAHFLNSERLGQIDWGIEHVLGAPELEAAYNAGILAFHERFSGQLSAEEFAIIEGFSPLIARWCDLRPKFVTLLHGDPRVDNVMFAANEDGTPSAYLIDWQLARLGDPQMDVAYFLTGSLSPTDRRSCEMRLIRRHAATLRAVDPQYTDDVALAAHRLNAVSGLAYTVASSYNIVSTPASDALLLALARRNCSAVADWESLNALN